MDILEEIRTRIESGNLTEEVVLMTISVAKQNIQTKKESECNHNWVYNNTEYGYNECSKCGKMKTS